MVKLLPAIALGVALALAAFGTGYYAAGLDVDGDPGPRRDVLALAVPLAPPAPPRLTRPPLLTSEPAALPRLLPASGVEPDPADEHPAPPPAEVEPVDSITLEVVDGAPLAAEKEPTRAPPRRGRPGPRSILPAAGAAGGAGRTPSPPEPAPPKPPRKILERGASHGHRTAPIERLRRVRARRSRLDRLLGGAKSR